jgi:hypothetical protein
MKPQSLSGAGPIAAFVSAGSLFVFFVIGVFGNGIVQAVPSLSVPLVNVIWLVALWLWVGSMAIVVFALGLTIPGAIMTRWFVVARWSMLVAVVLPAIIGIAAIADSVILGTAAAIVLALCLGVVLLVYNIGARRARLLGGVLPWLGIIAGAAYVIVAPSIVSAIGSVPLWVGIVFYVGWATGIGVHLMRRERAAAAEPARRS